MSQGLLVQISTAKVHLKEKDIVTLGEVRKWTHPLPQGTGTDHRHVKSCGVRHVPCSAEGREAVSLERGVEAGSRP